MDGCSLDGLRGKDPRVEGYIIYWNNRTDSVVGEIDRNNLLKDRYNFCIFNVKESSYEFELVQTGSKGVNSIASTVTGNVYGDSYISQLKIKGTYKRSRRRRWSQIDVGNPVTAVGMWISLTKRQMELKQSAVYHRK